jgi:dihydropteroate synthase
MESKAPAAIEWTWRLADRELRQAEPLVAGIVNVTSDSMYEGARSGTPEAAIEDGRRLVGEGF